MRGIMSTQVIGVAGGPVEGGALSAAEASGLRHDWTRDEVGAIPKANCWCTHSCFIQDSSKFSPKVQLLHIPAAGLRAAGGSL